MSELIRAVEVAGAAAAEAEGAEEAEEAVALAFRVDRIRCGISENWMQELQSVLLVSRTTRLQGEERMGYLRHIGPTGMAHTKCWRSFSRRQKSSDRIPATETVKLTCLQ